MRREQETSCASGTKCVDQGTGQRTGMAHTDTVNSLIDQIKSNQIKGPINPINTGIIRLID
jgi:hypothetical protein